MIKTLSKKTIDHIIDGIYMLCQAYIRWYLKSFIYPNEKKVVKCPECGSEDFTDCSFTNGAIYHKCFDCGRNWM